VKKLNTLNVNDQRHRARKGRGIRRSRQIALWLIAGLIGFGLGADARSRISAVSQLDCWSPRIAIDAAGNLHAIYLSAYSENRGDVFYCTLPAGGQQWTDPINLSNSGRVASMSKMVCSIGVDPSQNLIAAWSDVDSGVQMRVRSGSAWGATFQVAPFSRPDMTRLSIDGAGNLFLIWYSDERGEVYSRARVGGNWEEVKMLNRAGARAKFPDIAVNGGVVVAVFTQKSEDYDTQYCARSSSYNSAWSAPAPVHTEFPLAHQHPRVTVDNNGVAHVVYVHVYADDSANSLAYSYWTGSSPSDPINLSGWSFIHWPCINQKNNTVYVLWQEGSADGGQLYFRMGSRNNWSATNYVPDSYNGIHMDQAIDAQGNLEFVWSADGAIYYGGTAPGGGGGGGGGGGEPPPVVNQPPTANFTFSPSGGFAPINIQFDAAGSYDPDGTIVQWNWLFGDGGQETGRNVYHVFQSQGVYSIKLTVIDNEGLTDSQIKTIEILGIYPPLNVRWQTYVDESMFMTRYVTTVTWDRNPANDAYTIVRYRIYRKSAEGTDSWQAIGQTSADTFKFLDTNVKKKDFYSYAVTAIDDQGHESRLNNQNAEFTLAEKGLRHHK
jgi:PKD repeat protein